MYKENETNDLFQKKVENTFTLFKSGFSENNYIEVKDKTKVVARLRPITKNDLDEDCPTAGLLANWRQKKSEWFATRFTVTEAGTRKWLREQVIASRDRILFLLETLDGVPVGQMGFFNFSWDNKCCELDNILRGASDLPGVMTPGLQSLINWAFDKLGVQYIFLRVFSDNKDAISLYQKCNFKEIRKIPLKRIEYGDIIKWVDLTLHDCQSGERFNSYMVLKNPSLDSPVCSSVNEIKKNAWIYQNLPSLRKYVRIKEKKNIEQLEAAGWEWLRVLAENGLSYEIDWFGIPVIQSSEDLILMQELIFKIQPDVIIETGIAHGGGLIFYSSIMELLDKGKIIGVDIEIREHNRKVLEVHPLFKRIELIEGNSISENTILELKKRIPEGSKVIVCLDSYHAKDHVLRELELYKDFIPVGSYIVVFDTVTSRLAELGALESKYINNSPKEAIKEFLEKNDDFQIDKSYNKLYISCSLDGYLERIK